MSAKKKNNTNSQTKVIKEDNENKDVSNEKKNEVKNDIKKTSSNNQKKIESKEEQVVFKNKSIAKSKVKEENKNEKNDIKKKSSNNQIKNETKEEKVVFKNESTAKPKIKEENKNRKNNKSKSDISVEKNSKPKADISEEKNNKQQKTFKDNEEKKLDSDKKIEKNVITERKENVINTPEFFEEKVKNKRKVFFIITVIVTILIGILIFSTLFAIVHNFKGKIANGVKIKNIDVSGLTYEEAQEKLEEAFNTIFDANIELNYKDDYKYVIKVKNLNLNYNFQSALDEAYNVGRNSNIIFNNYSLIGTTLIKKNIDFEYTYSREDLNQIISEISTSIPDLVKQYSYYIEEDNLIIKKGIDGIVVKNDELKNAIESLLKNRNPIDIIKDFKNEEISIPYENVVADKIDIDKIYNEVHSEPKDAYYTEATETTKFAIYADVDGIDFAISIDEAKALVEEDKEEYIIPISRQKANITINDIGIEAFSYEISKFETMYDASNYSRSANLRIAANKINGKVIMPGQQFSFNEVVGERTVAEGYQNAKIYSDGQVVDGLAGGICQISSTLYNAVLLANLQIDERYNHSFTTSYVKPGRDATVVYGVKDLKFTNTRTYPIKIEANVANGVATFIINGIQEENEYKVEIIPTITSTIPYTTQSVVDWSLAPGTLLVKQAGASGYKVTTTKKTYLNGTLVSSDIISNDIYKPMTRIVLNGPAPVEVPTEVPVQP